MSILKRKKITLHGIKKIAILADCGCVKDWEKHFPLLLDDVWKKHTPELFIVIGDIGLKGWIYYYLKVIKYMKKYPVRWIAIPGNHDKPLSVFYLFFGSLHKLIDIGKWRFIGVNTAKKIFSKSEAKWLKKNIKENSIILSHIPPSVEGWSFYSLSEESTGRFFRIIDDNLKKISSMFFGHIHGYSEKVYSGIPMILTGGAAHSKVIRNNRYNEKSCLEMVIFEVKTGKRVVHEMNG